MNRPQAEDYLRWLEPQIRDEQDDHSRSYWELLGLMFNKEFVWLVPNDDNRIVDGLDLRMEFCDEQDISSDALRDLGPCSFLEVLIGLSRRLAFAAGGRAPGWAWQLLSNLELHRMADPLDRRKARKAEEILDAVIWRTYLPNGQGGFFPLIDFEEDQTQVELWYQMSAFIREMHPEY
jgi:hypothetical protein